MIGTAWNCDWVRKYQGKAKSLYVAFRLRPGAEAEAIAIPDWAWGRTRNLYKVYIEIEPPKRVTPADAERHNKTEARGAPEFFRIDRDYKATDLPRRLANDRLNSVLLARARSRGLPERASDCNRIAAPPGWTQIAASPSSGPSDDPITGFSAVAYRGPGGAIVIAYAGTNVESKLDNDWLQANVPAALGAYSPQVLQAAQFYWQVLNRPDVGLANKGQITFTGHSLGGGLASLMAAYFALPATTFDTAPFQLSAFVGSAIDQYAEKFAAAGIADAAWQQYLAARASSTLLEVFAQREAMSLALLCHQRSAGGAALRIHGHRRSRKHRWIREPASTYVSGEQLHSMLLAWAMLSNIAFAAEIVTLPRLFALMDDAHLFGRDRSTEEQDLFSLLLKFEHDTGMLTHFTGDVQDISDKFVTASATVSDALLATTMAHYYQMSNGFDAQVGEAVKSSDGGLDLTLGAADWHGRGFERTYELLREMVDLLSGGGAEAARAWEKQRLVISDGAALGFADASGKLDIVLGGTAGDSIALGEGDDYAGGLGGVDNLDGGGGRDVLDAGSGADTLDGGAGDDTLIGGTGTAAAGQIQAGNVRQAVASDAATLLSSGVTGTLKDASRDASMAGSSRAVPDPRRRAKDACRSPSSWQYRRLRRSALGSSVGRVACIRALRGMTKRLFTEPR